ASLGRLSAGLAHEIQNPLNFVGNFADLNVDLARDLLAGVRALRAGADPPDLDAIEADLESIVENARRVRDHARRAGGIVRSLMGHVRDVGGERRPADLHELLERAVSTQIPSGVRIVRTYGELPLVDVVPASMQQVFGNLLENAVYALKRRTEAADEDYQPTVTLATEAYDGGVQLRVADNGVGIERAHCARVFEPFFTTKPTGEGTGLGLSLAYDIVTEGHGGTLAVASREGEGATFTITLPA
ncbi:MAG: HAMP domain-containing sensor histidine kinase, partial [Bacteroidota bacterium]